MTPRGVFAPIHSTTSGTNEQKNAKTSSIAARANPGYTPRDIQTRNAAVSLKSNAAATSSENDSDAAAANRKKRDPRVCVSSARLTRAALLRKARARARRLRVGHSYHLAYSSSQPWHHIAASANPNATAPAPAPESKPHSSCARSATTTPGHKKNSASGNTRKTNKTRFGSTSESSFRDSEWVEASSSPILDATVVLFAGIVFSVGDECSLFAGVHSGVLNSATPRSSATAPSPTSKSRATRSRGQFAKPNTSTVRLYEDEGAISSRVEDDDLRHSARDFIFSSPPNANDEASSVRRRDRPSLSRNPAPYARTERGSSVADMGVSPATGDALSDALPNEPATTSRQTLAARGFDARASETVSEADALPSTAPDELVECTALEKSTPTSTPVRRSQCERARSWSRPRASRGAETPAREGGAGEGPRFAFRGAFRARAACASPRAISARAAATTGASITRRAPRARPAPTPPRTPARESLG